MMRAVRGAKTRSTFASRLAVGALVALGANVALGVPEAHAFCRSTTTLLPPSYNPQRLGCFKEGLPLFWKGACVTYSVQKDATSEVSLAVAEATIGRSFATWSSSTCADGTPVGIQTVARGPVECSEVRYNRDGPNQNLIVFREASWPYADVSSTLALTTVTFTADTGEIFDADIEINATNGQLSVTDPVPSREFDLESVMTHEVGHFLGLAHATETAATMFARYEPGTASLRSLTADDVAGLCAMYPNARERIVGETVADGGVLAAASCSNEPRRGFVSECEGPPPDEGWCALAGRGQQSDFAVVAAATLATLAMVGRRRRGRRPEPRS